MGGPRIVGSSSCQLDSLPVFGELGLWCSESNPSFGKAGAQSSYQLLTLVSASIEEAKFAMEKQDGNLAIREISPLVLTDHSTEAGGSTKARCLSYVRLQKLNQDDRVLGLILWSPRLSSPA